MKTFITSIAAAMLFAVTANAEIIHSADYETTTATGFGIASAELDFTDGGGDLIGFSAAGNSLTTGEALGLSTANPNSGSFHYAIDAGATTPAGNGWGASWSGIASDSSNTNGGFGMQANVIAAGVGSYINYTPGATFTVSALVATDALDPLIGSGTAAPRLEFFDATGAELFRNQSAEVNASTISSTYTRLSHSYTLTGADVALSPGGIDFVVAVLGTDSNGDSPFNDGVVYFDDFLFEVNSENVVTLSVPEPGSASLLLVGLMGLCGVRRRKN